MPFSSFQIRSDDKFRSILKQFAAIKVALYMESENRNIPQKENRAYPPFRFLLSDLSDMLCFVIICFFVS